MDRSAEPINLNKARKARAKAQKRQRAGENSVKFGRTKAEADRQRAEEARASEKLDGHLRDKE